MGSSHHAATGIAHFHNTAMLRRGVAFAPRISQAGFGPGRPRRVSGSATQDKGKQGRVAWGSPWQEVKKHRQTFKQVVKKNWEAWLFGALGSLGCLAYAYGTDYCYVWLRSRWVLAKPFTPRAKATYVRDVVTEKAEDLRTYVKQFDKTDMGSFVLVAGPQASGKTTCIETAFDGWKGVAAVEVNLDATAVAPIDFAEVLSQRFAHLKGVSGDVACARVSLMDDYCRRTYGHPLVLIVSIKSGNQPLPGDQAQIIAGQCSTSVGPTPTTSPRVPSSSRRQCPRYVLPQSACTKLHGPTDRRQHHRSLRQHLRRGVPPSHEP